MKVISLAALLLVACVAIIAQEEEDKCDTPDLWEGFEVRLDPGSAIYPGSMRRSYISYDATNMRFNRVDEERGNQTTQRYRDIFLHMEKVGYRINMTAKPATCEKFTLTESFRKIGVANSSTLSYKAIIGSDAVFEAGVEVNGYTEETDRGRMVAEWAQPGEGKRCVPIHESYIRRTTGDLVYASFYNITLGIRDPTVFIPPSECNQV